MKLLHRDYVSHTPKPNFYFLKGKKKEKEKKAYGNEVVGQFEI